MFFSDDMRQLVSLFKKCGVDFAVCGGFAVAHYGYVRMTMDFDLLVAPCPANAERIMKALEEFGFGGTGIKATDFMEPGAAVTLSEQPNQIDLLTSMSSADAGGIISRAPNTQLGDLEVKVVSYDDLIAAKKESSRGKDRVDLEELERLNEEK